MIGLKKLENENNIEKLFEKFKDVIDKKISTNSEVITQILGERLAYIIKGAPSSKPEYGKPRIHLCKEYLI